MPELILGACALIQGLLLLWPERLFNRRLGETLSAAGFLASAIALLPPFDGGEPMMFFGLLEDQPLLRLPRAALLLAGLLLGRATLSTREIPEGRKREVLFLLSVLALLCDLLLLSRHALLSGVLLISLSWLGLFLSGLAYRGRSEGEAVLKFWVQASVLVACCFGSVLVLALVAGGVHYDLIGAQLKTLAAYSPDSLLLILSLCLPYFLAGGIFPFHFVMVDRDHGLPWAVQLTLGVMVQGAITLAAWRMGVDVFGSAPGGGIAEGMRLLQLAGLVGGFWLALFSLSQTNSKRLFSALIGAQWSAILGAGAMPSLLGMSSVTYAFASTFLWSALLGFTWARLQEFAVGDRLEDVYGAARAMRVAGLVLLLSLAAPLCVPGFPGLPSSLHLLATMIEQKSLVIFVAEILLLSLICLTCLRVGTDLLFRPARTEFVSAAREFRYGALDVSAMALLGIALLVLGFFWNAVFVSLGESAKIFLN
jgi:NADH:ubiquinone oxidoreductase subunit 2 (subunit N)